MKKKALVSAALSIVLCLTLICGATFALFTDTDQVNIAVTSGKVAVKAEILDLMLFSRDVDQTKVGHFATGGTAIAEGNTLTLDRIVPGDKVTFKIKVTNQSNVDILYRTIVDLVEGVKLYETLEILINGEKFEQNVGTWTPLKAPVVAEGEEINEEITEATVAVSIEFPYLSTEQNEYQGLTTKLRYAVEAVQGNADVENMEMTNTTYLYDAADLQLLAASVANGTSYAGKTVKLMSDIDLAGIDWVPIGTAANPFKGTFDGSKTERATTYSLRAAALPECYTISNLTVSGSNDVGLFGRTDDPAVVKNVHVNNAIVSGRLNVGVIAGTPYTATFDNITITGDVKVTGLAYVGGAFGKNLYDDATNITIDVNEGSYVKADSVENGSRYASYAGGVVGFMGEGDHTLANIVSNIDVIANCRAVGGITGIAHYGNVLENCHSTGNVTIEDEYTGSNHTQIGGIAGVWHNENGYTVTITNCSYSGTLSNYSDTYPNNGIAGSSFKADGSGLLIIDGKVDGVWAVLAEEELINALTEGGKAVLYKDVTVAATITIPAGVVVDLDLNGKTVSAAITGNPVVLNQGTLTVNGGTIVNSISNAIKNEGALTVNGGTYNSGGAYGINNAAGTLVVNNGATNGIYNAGETTIHNVAIAQTVSGRHGIYHGGSVLTINGGVFSSSVGNELINAGSKTGVTINGGTFTQIGKSYLFGPANAAIVINEGIFNGYVNANGTNDKMRPGVAVVNGGTFNFDPTAWLADGLAAAANENGTWSVLPAKTITTIADGLYYDGADTYFVTNANGLFAVAEEVNKRVEQTDLNIFHGKTVKLMSDIDLGGVEWTPIGDYAFSRTSFRGTFDGQGHTVSNFKITQVSQKAKANEASYRLFGNINGTIKNLTVKNVTVDNGARYAAALVGRMHGGLIENCHVIDANVIIKAWQVGGVVAQMNGGDVKNCSIENSTVTGYAGVGAIVGFYMTATESTIENCIVKNCTLVQNGTYGEDYDDMFAGIVGALNKNGAVVRLNNCKVESTTIKGEASSALYGYVESGATIIVDGYTLITDGVFAKYNNKGAVVEYAISNVNGFVWLEAQDDNSLGGLTVKMMNDIDCDGVVLKPIKFWGSTATFDGCGYTIYNVDISGNPGGNNQALFNGTVNVKNVTVDGAWIEGNGYVAVLGGTVYGSFENCHVKNAQVFGGYWQTGIIVAQWDSGNMTGCSVTDSEVYSPAAAGALVGILNETAGERKIENCVVKNCTVAMNGRFGGDYDLMYGAAVGLINIENSKVYFNNCVLEDNTVKGVESNALYGVCESSTTVYVDGTAVN